MANDLKASLVRLRADQAVDAQALIGNGVEPDPLLIQELRASGADQAMAST